MDELGYTDLGDSLDDMKLRAKQRGFEFPYLYDGETQTASTAYGVLATPHAFLFDSDRKLRYVGRIDDNEIKQPTRQDLRMAIDEVEKVLNEKHCSASNYILDAENRDSLFEAVDPEWKGAEPSTALISPAGKVIHRVHGEFDPLELKRKIVEHIGRTYASDRKSP